MICSHCLAAKALVDELSAIRVYELVQSNISGYLQALGSHPNGGKPKGKRKNYCGKYNIMWFVQTSIHSNFTFCAEVFMTSIMCRVHVNCAWGSSDKFRASLKGRCNLKLSASKGQIVFSFYFKFALACRTLAIRALHIRNWVNYSASYRQKITCDCSNLPPTLCLINIVFHFNFSDVIIIGGWMTYIMCINSMT